VSTWLDPIEADAERARLRAGIRPDAAVPDLEAACQALGLVVVTRSLGPGRPEGIYLGHGLALLDPGGLPARTRFATAHLLAHHLYGDRPHLERELEWPWPDAHQRRASAFAACLLVGREALRARVPARVTTEAVLRLATEFQVSPRVVLRRLREAGLVEPEACPEPEDPGPPWPVAPRPGHDRVGRPTRPFDPGR
jgi:Zn-dependent peptidase ImmA (M78 family)